MQRLHMPLRHLLTTNRAAIDLALCEKQPQEVVVCADGGDKLALEAEDGLGVLHPLDLVVQVVAAAQRVCFAAGANIAVQGRKRLAVHAAAARSVVSTTTTTTITTTSTTTATVAIIRHDHLQLSEVVGRQNRAVVRGPSNSHGQGHVALLLPAIVIQQRQESVANWRFYAAFALLVLLGVVDRHVVEGEEQMVLARDVSRQLDLHLIRHAWLVDVVQHRGLCVRGEAQSAIFLIHALATHGRFGERKLVRFQQLHFDANIARIYRIQLAWERHALWIHVQQVHVCKMR